MARAERALAGQTASPVLFDDAAHAAARELDTHADLHATAEYRHAVAATLIVRALVDAAGRATDQAR